MRRIEKPSLESPKVKVLRPKPGEVTVIGIVGREVIYFVQHWDGFCCRECHKESESDYCEGCEKQWPPRVKGYLDVVRQSARERCILELTPLAADRLTEIVGGEQQLRGSIVEVGRGNGKKTALTFLLRAPMVGVHYPEPIDPTPHVRQLLNLEPRSKYRRPGKPGQDNTGEREAG